MLLFFSGEEIWFLTASTIILGSGSLRGSFALYACFFPFQTLANSGILTENRAWALGASLYERYINTLTANSQWALF